MLSWQVLLVQHTDACDWRADLFDYTTQESTHYRLDTTPVQIPLVNVDKGVQVHCRIDPAGVLSIGIFQQEQVDIRCRYPDDQMMTARAITIFDIFTGESLTHPVIVFFSNAKSSDEALYRLHVACQ